MDPTNNLKNIIKRQQEVLSELEVEYQVLQNSDLVKENASLKLEIEQIRLELNQLSQESKRLKVENKSLKNALYEQIYNEKVKIINTTAQKLNVYFRSQISGELNRLTTIEINLKKRIHHLRQAMHQNSLEINDGLHQKLDELSALLDEKVVAIRSEPPELPEIFLELEALKKEQITDEQIRAVTKKNNLERFMGLNVLNVVGVFLLIIGMITLSRFTYFQLPDMLRGIMIFVVGGSMLVIGEILNRKKPNVFSLGLSAGGVGILYVALVVSYFGLQILGMYPAIILCILITVGAFVLADRYHSQTIAAFALIGGYLPMFSIDRQLMTILYGAMIYFVVLNLLALRVSFQKKWRISSFIGLILNIVSVLYIFISVLGTEDTTQKLLTIVYVMFAFLVYTLIPIIDTYRTKGKFKAADIVLLGINTFFSSLIMYIVFYSFGFSAYHGLLAVIFASVYLLLGRFVEKKFIEAKVVTRELFYLTGLVFVVLVVPLQFGIMWLSLGWLAEGLVLSVYGIVKDEKRFKRVGLIICSLCLGAFMLFDVTRASHYLFPYKYLSLTLGSLVILGAFMYKKKLANSGVKTYKIFVLINVWLYLMYVISVNLGNALAGLTTVYQMDYLLMALGIVTTFALAYAYLRIKLLFDLATKILALILYAFGIIWLFFLNSLMSPVISAYWRVNLGITFIGTIILVALGLLSILALRELLRIFVSKRKLGVQWYPILISGYGVIILTQNLITQFNLAFSSVFISIIFALTAFAWIVFGFIRRYSFIRKFGLGLALLAVAKLFLIDLFALTAGYRIVSYFAFGVTFMAISFVYQYFSKRLELSSEVTINEE